MARKLVRRRGGTAEWVLGIRRLGCVTPAGRVQVECPRPGLPRDEVQVLWVDEAALELRLRSRLDWSAWVEVAHASFEEVCPPELL